MALRELDRNSVHWGGYSGVRLQVNPFDPLPSSLLGGVDVDEFLSDQLAHSSNPNSSGLGVLVDLESDAGNSSRHSVPWSVSDPNRSFYEEIFDYIFSSPGPSLPSDALRHVPRVVEQTMSVRGMQTPPICTTWPIRPQSPGESVPATEFQIVSQVRFLSSLVHISF